VLARCILLQRRRSFPRLPFQGLGFGACVMKYGFTPTRASLTMFLAFTLASESRSSHPA
jgi:hypothetical protein